MGAAHFGFLTVVREAAGYLGGYLVTNAWGRPLEFRLSSAVQPNRVQQVLYGETLERYLCADIIGKTLVEKTALAVQAIITDHPAVLDLRLHLDIPIACLTQGETPRPDANKPFLCHPQFPQDLPALRGYFNGLSLDLAEPFARVREALSEARKLGVQARA